MSNDIKSTQLAVITSESVKTEVTLVKAGVLKSRLGKMSKDSIATTLSLAYYTLVDGNVQPLSSSLQNITSLLHPVYRQYICAKFDGKTQAWGYNKIKATGLLKKLGGLKYKDCTFEAFVAALESQVETKEAKIAKDKADLEALSPAEKETKSKDRITSYLIKNMQGMTKEQRADIMIKVNKELSLVTA